MPSRVPTPRRIRRRQMWIRPTDCYVDATAPPTGGVTTAAINGQEMEWYAFDGAGAAEMIHFVLPWNRARAMGGGTGFRYRYYCSGAASGTSTVHIGLSGNRIGNDDAIGQTLSYTEVEDTSTANDDLMVSPWSATGTIQNAPVENDLIVFTFQRDSAHANDDLGTDMRLHAIELLFLELDTDETAT